MRLRVSVWLIAEKLGLYRNQQGTTMTVDTATQTVEQLAQRSDIRAFRAGRYILIVANGELPDPGYDVDIEPSVLQTLPRSTTCSAAGVRGRGHRSSPPTPTARYSRTQRIRPW
jgi:hypothetical protein